MRAVGRDYRPDSTICSQNCLGGGRCGCKPGYQELGGDRHRLGYGCHRWLSHAPTNIDKRDHYYELVPEPRPWGPTTVRGWAAPRSIDPRNVKGTACGYAVCPSATVARLIQAYVSANAGDLGPVPGDRVWTCLREDANGRWLRWSSMQYSHGAETGLDWGPGEPSGGRCVSMSIAPDTAGQLRAENCTSRYWYVRSYAAFAETPDSPSPEVHPSPRPSPKPSRSHGDAFPRTRLPWLAALLLMATLGWA